jgi:hypothetical protein
MINPTKLPKIYGLLEKFVFETKKKSESIGFLKDCKIQCDYNIPILLLTALHLGQYCLTHKLNRVLFSSRDCFYLVKVFNVIFGNCIESKYFYTSRYSRINPTDTYKSYCSSLINDKTLIVDLCGTGNSLSCLYESLKIRPNTFFLHLIQQNSQEKNTSCNSFKRNIVKNISYLIKGEVFNNIYIEISNYSINGMFLDMKFLSSKKEFVPIFMDPKYPIDIGVRIGNFCHLWDLFLDEIKLLDINELINEQRNNSHYVTKTIEALYVGLTMQECEFSDFFHYHFKDYKAVEKLIKHKQNVNYPLESARLS